MLFNCRVCGHSEMVHQQFSGCCHVEGCECLGMDGSGPFCSPILHTEAHNAFVARDESDPVLGRWRKPSAEDRKRIIAMKNAGGGRRTIARELDLHHATVRLILQAEFGKGTDHLPAED